ncbi:hypothetical protein ACUV0W_000333 [Klebsiella pneumoniae]|uniref:hypothetical protein n=1 Tax=Klebsiella pneumoniae TaxID=573 RepID=UPI0027F74018|nr:hypothetical protein [Klebsiella pneumoniae]
MNIETINELIASLESAGELSIKETKVMALAKAYQQLAAENVGLKAGATYFAYSPEYGFDYFKDKQSAIDTAQAEIDAYREDVDDGWSEDVQRVSWGVVIQQAQGFYAQGLHTSDSQHIYQTCDYRLVDSVATPATDRIVAGIKADGRAEGINFAASRLAAAFNHGFVDKPMAEVGDVVRMILDAKADLANSPTPPEDGLSGEYAEKSLAEWETKLREGAK